MTWKRFGPGEEVRCPQISGQCRALFEVAGPRTMVLLRVRGTTAEPSGATYTKCPKCKTLYEKLQYALPPEAAA